LNERLQSLEKNIQEHIDVSKKEQEDAKKRKEELQDEPEDEDDDGAQQRLAIEEVDERSRLLEADQASSKAVSAQISKVVAFGHQNSSIQNSGNINYGNQTIDNQNFGSQTYGGHTFGNQNSGFQAGTVNGGVKWNHF
jgi:hypothetical protein